MSYKYIQKIHDSISRIIILQDSAFASCFYRDKPIKIWKQNDDMIWECIQTLIGHTDYINYLTVLSDITFASCSDDKTIKIWKQNDDMKWECIQTLRENSNNLIVLPDDTLCIGSRIFSTPYFIKRIKSKIIFNNVIKNILS